MRRPVQQVIPQVHPRYAPQIAEQVPPGYMSGAAPLKGFKPPPPHNAAPYNMNAPTPYIHSMTHQGNLLFSTTNTTILRLVCISNSLFLYMYTFSSSLSRTYESIL